MIQTISYFVIQIFYRYSSKKTPILCFICALHLLCSCLITQLVTALPHLGAMVSDMKLVFGSIVCHIKRLLYSSKSIEKSMIFPISRHCIIMIPTYMQRHHRIQTALIVFSELVKLLHVNGTMDTLWLHSDVFLQTWSPSHAHDIFMKCNDCIRYNGAHVTTSALSYTTLVPETYWIWAMIVINDNMKIHHIIGYIGKANISIFNNIG